MGGHLDLLHPHAHAFQETQASPREQTGPQVGPTRAPAEERGAGIAFEVVPGISSIVAAPNYAGIPITHRDHCSSFMVITGHEDLLADNPTLARSVFNRFPYLEPLNHLQVDLLRRYRSGEDDELVQRGILLTMNGLASALRNSG